jgi:murein tripeptide amidase MpaA
VISKFSIGKTAQGRDIYALQIADVTGIPLEDRVGMLITSATHPRELVSACYSLYILLKLTKAPTPELSYLLKTRIIYLVPVVNVDGYVYISNQYITKR